MTLSEKSIPIGRRRSQEFLFREFFELGLEESASPFLTPFGRKISRNLPLKASLFAAFLLLIAFLYSFSPLSIILLSGVYLIVGVPALINAVEDIVLKKDVNIDVLMTLAAFAAIFIGSGFEGALLLVLFALSGAIEDAVTLKAKSSLMTLHRLVPLKASLLQDGQITERAVQDVPLGSIALVRVGEVVPLDGIVVDGTSAISLEHLTGESVPVKKQPGDHIPSGAQVIDGALQVRVTHLSRDSTVARIVQLITKAQSAKPNLERWFDRFGRRYAISIITLAFFAGVTFAPLLGITYFGNEGSIYRALAFLITASPCALILAVPIAYLSSLGACAKKGIVLKGGVVLDALEDCSIIAFDKTGTLTLGELHFEDIVGSFDEVKLSKEELLSIAATLERNAVHPIAKAIERKAKHDKLSFLRAKEVSVMPGLGVQASVFYDGKERQVFIGDLGYAEKLLSKERTKELRLQAFKLQKEGKVIAAFIVDRDGFVIAFSDRPRPRVSEMLDSLKRSGHKIVMLTGDHKESARLIANQVGIEDFEAELKPEDKLRRIEELSKDAGLAMCGDGINDAPALARATVGISMGQIGSATAQAAADVVLLHDNIELLDWLFSKAKKTRQIVTQNLLIASVAIVCGSIPALYGVMPLWLAVIVHEGGTVLVGLNAIRLLKN